MKKTVHQSTWNINNGHRMATSQKKELKNTTLSLSLSTRSHPANNQRHWAFYNLHPNQANRLLRNKDFNFWSECFSFSNTLQLFPFYNVQKIHRGVAFQIFFHFPPKKSHDSLVELLRLWKEAPKLHQIRTTTALKSLTWHSEENVVSWFPFNFTKLKYVLRRPPSSLNFFFYG